MAAWLTEIDVLEELISTLRDSATFNIELLTNYSANGLYPAGCVGFATADVVSFAMLLAGTLAVMENLRNYSDQLPFWNDLHPGVDSSDAGTVVYFPNWQLATTTEE